MIIIMFYFYIMHMRSNKFKLHNINHTNILKSKQDIWLLLFHIIL